MLACQAFGLSGRAHDRLVSGCVFDLCEEHARGAFPFQGIIVWSSGKRVIQSCGYLGDFEFLGEGWAIKNCPGHDSLRPLNSVHLQNGALAQLLRKVKRYHSHWDYHPYVILFLLGGMSHYVAVSGHGKSLGVIQAG